MSWDSTIVGTLDNIKGKPWLIGQEWDGSSASSFTKGAIDEVAFYDHNLTWNEINDIYTNGVTVKKGDTVEYTYDLGGNIRSKITATYHSETGESSSDTITYEYGDTNWKDKLTSYDGKTITYDAIGNPLTYDGYSYTWQNGRELAGISGNGINATYKYNDAGIRTQKIVNGVVTMYHLVGDQVTYEESYNENDPGNKFDQIFYTYDANNNLVSMNLDGVEYYYIKNIQGDIIGLLDKDGIEVASYTYDTWGKLISIQDQNNNNVTTEKNNVGYINSYRYRGYRYDTESGLFYVGSRYYDSEIGRFINADGEISGVGGDIRGYNLYSYCFNNPVNMSVPTGNWPKLSTIFTMVAVAAVVVAAVALVVTTCGVAAMAGGGIIGGISAGAAATAATVATTALVTAGVAVTAAVVSTVVENTNYQGPKRDQTVYKLVKPGSSTPEYIGRTNNPTRRANEHAKNPAKADLEMIPLASGLTKMEARAYEQIVISAYTLGNLQNARREIASGNIAGFEGNMNNTIKLFGGLAEDELLNLMGR